MGWGTVEKVAGRELDALVAEKVMGWCVGSDGEEVFYDDKRGWVCKPHCKPIISQGIVAYYSTSISAAWEVVEKLAVSGKCSFAIERFRNKPYSWQVEFGLGVGWTVYADTAPLAICLAALKAVGKG